MAYDFLGVVILESLTDPGWLTDHRRLVIERASDVLAPPGDPYPLWRRRLGRVASQHVLDVADELNRHMIPDFYNHFVDSKTLVVVFAGRFFKYWTNTTRADGRR